MGDMFVHRKGQKIKHAESNSGLWQATSRIINIFLYFFLQPQLPYSGINSNSNIMNFTSTGNTLKNS